MVNFTKKADQSLFTLERFKKVDFQRFCTFSGTYTQPLYKFFSAATECGRSKGGWNFGNFLPIILLN